MDDSKRMLEELNAYGVKMLNDLREVLEHTYSIGLHCAEGWENAERQLEGLRESKKKELDSDERLEYVNRIAELEKEIEGYKSTIKELEAERNALRKLIE